MARPENKTFSIKDFQRVNYVKEMQYTNKKWTTTILKQVPKSSMFSHTESVKISKKVISPFF